MARCQSRTRHAEVEAATEDLAPGEMLMIENVRFHAEEEANDREFAKQLRATGATSILRSRRCWNGDAIPKQALRATSKPAPSLVRCSQVAHCLHHYAAVDLVVLHDLAHELQDCRNPAGVHDARNRADVAVRTREWAQRGQNG